MQKLINIQKKLKAPKDSYNSFGGYKYRSCEQILEAVKPLLAEENCELILTDDIILIGDRYYVKASAHLSDGTDYKIVTAFAREDEKKKGMDGSQITGTASSYARKYALNGLFLIDDTKDADTDEHAQIVKKASEKASREEAELATDAEKKVFTDRCKQLDVDYRQILQQVGVKGLMTKEQHGEALIILKDIEEAKQAQVDAAQERLINGDV
jgi:hypothetical protein